MNELTSGQEYDVVVVGSGAGGLLAALCCHDFGLKTIVVEKSHYYGGTSALSGGQFWIPANHLMSEPDSKKLAAGYIRTVTRGEVADNRIDAYLTEGPAMARHLEAIGMKLEPVSGHPDYFPEVAGGIGGRSLVPASIDAAMLGDQLDRLREQPQVWKIFNRYSMETKELGIFGLRRRGWKRAFAKLLARYWLDIPWRLKTRRDRRLTLGNALVGGLRKALLDRGVPIQLNTALIRLLDEGNGVAGGVFCRDGNEVAIAARQAVILATGGFEHNQVMRDKYHPVPTFTRMSITPGTNSGDAIRAGQAIGADTEFLEHSWWSPNIELPIIGTPNMLAAHALFRNPHSVCVDRSGFRFVNEACSYDRFGHAMIESHKKTGAAIPCWMVFDANFRAKYVCGGLMPTAITPDARVPSSWWDSFIYRAETIGALATKIGVDPDNLQGTVNRMNEYASSGIDLEFGRGNNAYDRVVSGDPRVRPNPSLGPINKPPYYAVRVELGDIGTKGGLRVDQDACVLSVDGSIIPGLYAIGNTAGSIFAGAYPGPGATLGPALTFGYIAANDIAKKRWAAPVNEAPDSP